MCPKLPRGCISIVTGQRVMIILNWGIILLFHYLDGNCLFVKTVNRDDWKPSLLAHCEWIAFGKEMTSVIKPTCPWGPLLTTPNKHWLYNLTCIQTWLWLETWLIGCHYCGRHLPSFKWIGMLLKSTWTAVPTPSSAPFKTSLVFNQVNY